MALSRLVTLSISSLRNLDIEANKFYAFFTSEQPKRYKVWSCQKMCDALHYILDNIFIRFGSTVYR